MIVAGRGGRAVATDALAHFLNPGSLCSAIVDHSTNERIIDKLHEFTGTSVMMCGLEAFRKTSPGAVADVPPRQAVLVRREQPFAVAEK
jgi:hypothetical protein